MNFATSRAPFQIVPDHFCVIKMMVLHVFAVKLESGERTVTTLAKIIALENVAYQLENV